MADTSSLTCINLSCKKEKCCMEVKDDDRISKLPNVIICQILSYFPTKESVRTSILSRQWRYIWTSVPNLDFDDQIFLQNKERREVEIEDCFRAFVNRVLGLHCVSSIHKFRLSIHRDYGFYCMADWINAAMTHNIEEIHLNLCVDWQLLPQKFFNNKKLVVLKLYYCVDLPLPALVHLPNLKILILDCVQSIDEVCMKNLLSGCPVLEKLDINRDYDEVSELYIWSPSLKSLIVNSRFEEEERDAEYKIVIESPNLQYLHLGDRVTEDFRVTRSPSLEKVFLDLGQPDSPFVEDDVYGCRLLNLLKVTSNMKDLNITTRFFMFIKYDDLPVFHNLRSLTLAFTFHETSGDILLHLLANSPNLQTVCIENDYLLCKLDDPEKVAIKWDSPCWVPKCLSSCLEILEITDFNGYDGETEMIAYFLKNAMVLKKVVIECEILLDSDTKSKLLMFPRSSNTCEVIISCSP